MADTPYVTQEALRDLQVEVGKLGLNPLETMREFDRQFRLRGYVLPPEDQYLSDADYEPDCPSDFSEDTFANITGEPVGRRRRQSTSSDEDSDDSDVDRSKVAYTTTTIVNRDYTPVVPNPEKRIYSRAQLYGMIPEKPEFDSLRERLRLQKTVTRFVGAEPGESNRNFKRRYVFKWGHIPPKDLPRETVVLRGEELIPYYGKDLPTVEKPLPFGGKPQRYISREMRRAWLKNLVHKRLEAQKARPKESRMRRAVRFDKYDDVVIKTHLGGVSKQLPAAHHKKYWYFLRKRGSWKPSIHHPYGDELEVYADLSMSMDVG